MTDQEKAEAEKTWPETIRETLYGMAAHDMSRAAHRGGHALHPAVQGLRDSVGGILVNMVIGPVSVGPNTAEFVKTRLAMLQEHIKTIWKEFGDSVRAIVPLFETEVRGVPMLQRLCDANSADGAKPTGDSAGRPQQVGTQV